MPAHPAISDDDEEEEEDDVADPDFCLTHPQPGHSMDKCKHIQPVMEVLQENGSEDSEDDDDDGDDNVQPAVQAQRPRRSAKLAPRPTTFLNTRNLY